MAKIHNPQDQNGIGLINQTVFDEEHALRVAEEARIDGKLDDEVTRSTEEDERLDSAIKAEADRATDEEERIEGELNDAIKAEADRASAKEVLLEGAIEAETVRATGAENAITTNLNNEIKRAIAEEVRIDDKLSVAIKSECDRASEAEGMLKEDIAALGNDIISINDEIDSINAAIDSIKEPTIRAFDNERNTLNEIVVNLNEQVSDITIYYESSAGVIFASTVVSYSSYFVANKQASQISPSVQEDFNITFKDDLSAITDEIKEYIIIDAIVADIDCNNCKHISRILPITFKHEN